MLIEDRIPYRYINKSNDARGRSPRATTDDPHNSHDSRPRHFHDVRRRHVRSHRVQVRRDRRWCRPRQARDPGRRPAIPRGTYSCFFVRSFVVSLVRGAGQSQSQSHRIASRGGLEFAIGTSGRRGSMRARARCATDGAARGMIRMNTFLFVYPRGSSRASRRRYAGLFERVSRCPRARRGAPRRALLSDLDGVTLRRMCDGCSTRVGLFDGGIRAVAMRVVARGSSPSRVGRRRRRGRRRRG